MKVGYFPEKQLSYEGNQPNKTEETIRMFWFSEIFSIDLKKYFLTLKYRIKNRTINLLLFPQSTTATSNISSPLLSRKKTIKSNRQYSEEVRTEKEKTKEREVISIVIYRSGLVYKFKILLGLIHIFFLFLCLINRYMSNFYYN